MLEGRFAGTRELVGYLEASGRLEGRLEVEVLDSHDQDGACRHVDLRIRIERLRVLLMRARRWV